MKHKPIVSFIIPTYNNKVLLKTCLESVYKQEVFPFEVILVDNGSTENIRDLLCNNYNKVRYLRLNHNYGFAKACNEGIKQSKGGLIALINNDAILCDNWLSNIYQTACKNPEISVFASKVLRYFNQNIIESAGDYISNKLEIKHRFEGKTDKELYNKEKLITIVPAVASLYRKEYFNEIGMFDENFNSYFEDVDLSLRGQLRGKKYLYVPTAKVIHRGKATSKYLKSRGYLEFRNSMLVWMKILPTKTFVTRKVRHKLFKFYLKLIFQDFRPGKVIDAIKAIIYIVINVKLIYNERNKIQLNRNVDDEYFKKLTIGEIYD